MSNFNNKTDHSSCNTTINEIESNNKCVNEKSYYSCDANYESDDSSDDATMTHKRTKSVTICKCLCLCGLIIGIIALINQIINQQVVIVSIVYLFCIIIIFFLVTITIHRNKLLKYFYNCSIILLVILNTIGMMLSSEYIFQMNNNLFNNFIGVYYFTYFIVFYVLFFVPPIIDYPELNFCPFYL